MTYTNNPDVFLRINDQDSNTLKANQEMLKQKQLLADPLYVENIFKKIHYNAQYPTYVHVDDSGMDIRACIDNSVVLKPNIPIPICTGLSANLPVNSELQIRSRSGLSIKGVIVANSPGTIDEGYKGEIKIILINLGLNDFTINNDDRIAQVVFHQLTSKIKMPLDHIYEVRGNKGLGSTGVK
jgi:dUTP pyrophosphatase